MSMPPWLRPVITTKAPIEKPVSKIPPKQPEDPIQATPASEPPVSIIIPTADKPVATPSEAISDEIARFPQTQTLSKVKRFLKPEKAPTKHQKKAKR